MSNERFKDLDEANNALYHVNKYHNRYFPFRHAEVTKDMLVSVVTETGDIITISSYNEVTSYKANAL
jgi:hypothetical protein